MALYFDQEILGDGKEVKRMKAGEKYLSGAMTIIAGMPMQVRVFPNDKKTEKNQPDFNIMIQSGDGENTKLVKVGALWTQEKKATIDEKVKPKNFM